MPGGLTGVVFAGRRLAGQTLVDKIIRQDLVVVGDGMGGQRQTWTDVGRKVACRFGTLNEADSAGRQARSTSGQLEGVAGGILITALGTSLEEGDRVRDIKTGRIWLIMGEATPPSEMAVIRRLYIREI